MLTDADLQSSYTLRRRIGGMQASPFLAEINEKCTKEATELEWTSTRTQ